ncbi:ATP-grasp domain-containing protein [Sanguibacter antarcticus]|uniref:ATP-grasp domain-containing protein n=1 Tax=Sanguibacter antarcticus TaxID=372484 RepID=A0A2A9E492_9MICO|nr:hypothetical protein [Sanguibacter antarcticus]PFG33653.1 hypothetical protein ATL42_1536 [Sanguibacter antarcticus]
MPTTRVALATCSILPDLDPDDVPLIGALAERGVEAVAAVWDDAEVDWDSFDLVVVRSTWDYSSRPEEFIAWARSVPRLANDAELIAWNTDKYYLKTLGEMGIPIVRTLWLDPDRHLTSQAIHTRLPAHGDYVIKPTVSAGSRDTARYQENTAQARGEAILHARELLRSGRHVMVQPYLNQVDVAGETGLVFIAGEFSHAIRKNAMLSRGHRPTQGLYQEEVMRSVEASEAELALAQRALEAARTILGTAAESLLYARIDTLPGDDGEPILLELELTEPSMFLAKAPASLERFADAIAARAAR